MSAPYQGTITTKSGEVIESGPYPFRRLYKRGQGIDINRVSYIVLSCEQDEARRTVTTVVQPSRELSLYEAERIRNGSAEQNT